MSDVVKPVKVEFIESYIKGVNGSADYQWNDNHGELIRCKDCKYWCGETILEYRICKKWDKHLKNFSTMADWYCADGVKKDG